MNGYECGVCDCSPCVCKERERNKRIKDGQEVIQSFVQAWYHLDKTKKAIIYWLCPDLRHIMVDIEAHYKANRKYLGKL